MRPVIGLDECFLKEPASRVLLSVVSRDANNQIFPIAVAEVKNECEGTWKWFLTCFLEEVGDVRRDSLIFLSDRQKGLLEATMKSEGMTPNSSQLPTANEPRSRIPLSPNSSSRRSASVQLTPNSRNHQRFTVGPSYVTRGALRDHGGLLGRSIIYMHRVQYKEE